MQGGQRTRYQSACLGSPHSRMREAVKGSGIELDLADSAAVRLATGADVSYGFYLERPVYLALAVVTCSRTVRCPNCPVLSDDSFPGPTGTCPARHPALRMRVRPRQDATDAEIDDAGY